MWYLIYSTDDNSYSIVDDAAVISAGETASNGEVVTFFYGQKSYIGKITMISDDRDALDEELGKIGKKAKRAKKPKAAPACEKRKVNPPQRFSPAAASSLLPKEKRSKSTKAQDKKIKLSGEREMCRQVLQEGGSALAENLSDNESLKEEDSDSEFLSMVRSKEAKTNERNSLVKRLRKSLDVDEMRSDTPVKHTFKSTDVEKAKCDNDAYADCTLTGEKRSPTKEEYKAMYLQAKLKLSMVCEESPSVEKYSKTEVEKLPVSGLHQKEDNSMRSLDSADFDSELSVELSGCKSVQGGKKDLHDEHANNEDDDSNVRDLDDPNQLFGKDCPGHNMMLLSDGIFCKKDILDNALKNSHRTNHFVRRVLEGVFTSDALLNSTLTGRKPTAAGKDNYDDSSKVSGLHSGAIDAIIFSFTKQVAKIKHWEWRKNETAILRSVLSQKVGEVSRRIRKSQAPAQGAP